MGKLITILECELIHLMITSWSRIDVRQHIVQHVISLFVSILESNLINCCQVCQLFFSPARRPGNTVPFGCMRIVYQTLNCTRGNVTTSISSKEMWISHVQWDLMARQLGGPWTVVFCGCSIQYTLHVTENSVRRSYLFFIA